MYQLTISFCWYTLLTKIYNIKFLSDHIILLIEILMNVELFFLIFLYKKKNCVNMTHVTLLVVLGLMRLLNEGKKKKKTQGQAHLLIDYH